MRYWRPITLTICLFTTVSMALAEAPKSEYVRGKRHDIVNVETPKYDRTREDLAGADSITSYPVHTDPIQHDGVSRDAIRQDPVGQDPVLVD